MRFSLIDKIIDLQPGESITAVKSVSLAEEYLQDHFPGFPILPGVLMVEALVQTSAWLVRATQEFAESTVLLKEARAVKFNNFVAPGKTLRIQSELTKRDGSMWTFKAAGTVEGTSAVTAKLILESSNVGDRVPAAGQADKTQLAAHKSLFATLWSPPA